MNIKKCKNSVEILEFDNLSKVNSLVHGFSTRRGGVSTGVYSSMNLGFQRGDDYDNVLENYERFTDCLGIKKDNLVFASQVHSTVVRSVGRDNCGEGIIRETAIKNYDGLITNESGVYLATMYADCVPLYFVDPVSKTVALSHGGWKGTLNNIVKSTIHKMVHEFNSDPKNILMGIGPSIGVCCFEVRDDVAGLFAELPAEICDGCIIKKDNTEEDKVKDKGKDKDKKEVKEEYEVKDNDKDKEKVKDKAGTAVQKDEADNKYYINLQEINRRMALEQGLKYENIEMGNFCTSCHSDYLFSHRVMGDKRGSLCAVLGFK